MEGESDFRHWDELVPDALGLIFKNLEIQEVLEVIPLVCKSWCKVVEGPYCWQRIDIYEYSKHCRSEQLDRMLRTLITRSLGSMCELKVSCVDDDQLFSFIAEHAGSLQKLTLRSSSISDSVVERVGAKFSSLSCLNLGRSYLSTQALEAILRNCKSLVAFSWERDPSDWSYSNLSHRDEALIIARSMPQLKFLSIAHLGIDTPIVLEILSGCRELEWLDVRGCWDVELDGKLLEEKYPKMKVVTSERRSCSDEEWDGVADHYTDDYHDTDDYNDYHDTDDYNYYNYYNDYHDTDDYNYYYGDYY